MVPRPTWEKSRGLAADMCLGKGAGLVPTPDCHQGLSSAGQTYDSTGGPHLPGLLWDPQAPGRMPSLL